MRLARRTLLLFTFVTLLAPGVDGQPLPLTPYSLGVKIDTVRADWGPPDEVREGVRRGVGKYVAWSYQEARMPFNDPRGTRDISFLFVEGSVVAAAVLGAVEEGAQVVERLKKRSRYARNHWGPPSRAGPGSRYWAHEEGAYKVAALTDAEASPTGAETGRLVVVLGREDAWELITKSLPSWE